MLKILRGQTRIKNNLFKCVALIPFIEKPQTPFFNKVRSTITAYISFIINAVTVLRTSEREINITFL